MGIGIAILLQMAVIYIPFLSNAFQTSPLNISQWGIVLIAGAALFVIEEVRKIVFPRLFNMGKFMPFKRSVATDTGD
jgi:Ca2+-transporting ATPase